MPTENQFNEFHALEVNAESIKQQEEATDRLMREKEASVIAMLGSIPKVEVNRVQDSLLIGVPNSEIARRLQKDLADMFQC